MLSLFGYKGIFRSEVKFIRAFIRRMVVAEDGFRR
jgi:hypothetical protein